MFGLGTWLSRKATHAIFQYFSGNNQGKAPTPFHPWPGQQRPYYNPSQMQDEHRSAGDWQNFRDNPPYILGGRTPNDLGHPPGCSCPWCQR